MGADRSSVRTAARGLGGAARATLGRAARALTVDAIARVLWLAPMTIMAASPSPAAQGGGDPRSSGSGPGLVGDPLAAILIVVVIGALALGATLVYVRATGGREARPRDR